MKHPVKIQKTDTSIKLTWDSGEETEISLQKLRDECPCVNCKGESVIFNSYIPIKAPFKPQGFYEVEKIEPVGNYAVQITWKDKHNMGIYSWDVLQNLSK